MSESRKLPAAEPRVETGVVEFGEDWPGLFIRGKHAFFYAQLIDYFLRCTVPKPGINATEHSIRWNQLAALLDAMRSTRVKPKGPVQ